MEEWKNRLRQAREVKKLNKTEFAKAVGVSNPTVTDWEKSTDTGGIRDISGVKLAKVAEVLGVSSEWILTGKNSGESAEPVSNADGFIEAPLDHGGMGVQVGTAANTVPIRAVKLKLTAGVSGFVAEPDMDVDGGYYSVPQQVIDDLRLNPADLLVVGVRGRSMEPMIFDGEKILIDTSKRTPINNECFAVNWNGEPLVKCLIKKADSWCLYSMNRDPEYHTIDVRSGQCSIVGMVVWQPARIVKGRM